MFTKQFLSASVNGRPIPLTAVAVGQAHAIHTAPAGSDMDEVWIWATNTTGADVQVTVCFGGVESGDYIVGTVEANSSKQIVPGVAINNALVVKAFSAVAAGINLWGFVNRIE